MQLFVNEEFMVTTHPLWRWIGGGGEGYGSWPRVYVAVGLSISK